MQSILSSMLICTFLGTGMAIAQSVTGEAMKSKSPRHIVKFNEQFKAADKNGDGALSREEAENADMKRIVDHFDKLDVNKDGKVTRDEIRALIRSRLSI